MICLTRHQEKIVQAKDEDFMFRIIRASFNQRRKTLVNALNNAPNLPLEKEQIITTLEELGLNPNIRGEALTLEQFAQLSNLLNPTTNNPTADTVC